MLPSNHPVICDFVRVTVPPGDVDSVMSDISPCLDAIGASADSQGSYRVGTGVFSQKVSHGVGVFSASGQILAELRAHGLLSQFLMSFSSSPHKVTRVDAAMDVPIYAPDAVRSVYFLAHNEKISLSRKVVKRRNVSKHFSPVLYEESSSRETGSVYCGGPKAEVRAVIYDKRQEILVKRGFDIGEHRTRVECRVSSGMSPSLRDVFEPAPMFHHFMSPCLVNAPDPPVAWVSSGGSFSLNRAPVLPFPRLRSIVDGSRDFERVFAIASSLGEPGLLMALSFIEKRMRAHLVSGSVPSAVH